MVELICNPGDIVVSVYESDGSLVDTGVGSDREVVRSALIGGYPRFESPDEGVPFLEIVVDDSVSAKVDGVLLDSFEVAFRLSSMIMHSLKVALYAFDEESSDGSGVEFDCGV